MPNLDAFSFSDKWSPFFFLFLVAVAALYLIAVGPKREVWFPNTAPVDKRRKTRFITGLALLYAAFGSPLDLAGHLMFTWHMSSMSLAYMCAPPLLLMGMSEGMLRGIPRLPIIRSLKFMLNPMITILLFNMLFSFYHVPFIHDYVMTHYAVHIIIYIVLLITAMMLWWPVLCPLPEMNTMSDVKKMGYIFANGVLLTPACALIIFAGDPLYATYTDPKVWAQAMGFCVSGNMQSILEALKGPNTFAVMPAIEDQQLGGVVMKLMQEAVYGSTLAYVFYHWYRRENPRESDESVDSVPNGLNRI